jgi:hypothetical protein
MRRDPLTQPAVESREPDVDTIAFVSCRAQLRSGRTATTRFAERLSRGNEAAVAVPDAHVGQRRRS